MLKKKMMNILLTVVLFYLGVVVYLYFNQRNMMYFPDSTRPDIVPGAELAEVTTQDGLTLQGWYFPPRDDSKPVILFFHGNAGNFADRVWRAASLGIKGYGVLLAEYRGYGGNPGKITEQGLYNDGRAYVEFLKKQERPVVLHGESLGTGIATRLASEYDVAGLILESPYSSIADVAQSFYPVVPVRYLLSDKFPSADVIGKVKAPILMIHGELDRTIPIRFSRRLFDAAPEPKSFISLDSADHNNLYDHGAALHVLEFLSTIAGHKKE